MVPSVLEPRLVIVSSKRESSRFRWTMPALDPRLPDDPAFPSSPNRDRDLRWRYLQGSSLSPPPFR